MNPLKLTHKGLPDGYSFKQFKIDLRIARALLGLSSREHLFLSQLMNLTLPEDYESGAICAVFHNVRNLAEKISFSVRTINDHERKLTSWLVVTAPKRGRRDGDRFDGKILWAAGINLQPLVDNAEMVRELAQQTRVNNAKLECLRCEILKLREALIAIGQMDTANKIYNRARPSEIKNQTKLGEIRDQLRSALDGDKQTTVRKKTYDVTAETSCPNTGLNQSLKSCTSNRPKRKLESIQFDVRTFRKLSTETFLELWEKHEQDHEPLKAFIYAAEEVFLSWNANPKIWTEALSTNDHHVIALCVFIINRNMQPDVKERYFVKKPVGCFIGQLRALKTQGLNIHGMLAQLEKQERYRNVA